MLLDYLPSRTEAVKSCSFPYRALSAGLLSPYSQMVGLRFLSIVWVMPLSDEESLESGRGLNDGHFRQCDNLIHLQKPFQMPWDMGL